MSGATSIEWATDVWNPIRGCTRVSEGCRNCYAERVAARFSGPGLPYEGLAERGSKGPRWTGKVAWAGDETLMQPLHWRKPRRIFVNSMSDLFHESVPDEWVDRIFAVMALAPQHTFQVLTKRPERMREYCAGRGTADRVWHITKLIADRGLTPALNYHSGGKALFNPAPWPLRNVWLGVSVEDQATAHDRIPHLLAKPAAVRFISAEPLLGPVDLENVDFVPFLDSLRKIPRPDPDNPNWPRMLYDTLRGHIKGPDDIGLPKLDWVIVGGESGPGARPMHPDWARSLRDQCAAAGVAFFMKQMSGNRKPLPPIPDDLMIREFPHGH
jgi:protein gp37